VENVSWMKKNHMVDEILLLCHEILNKVAELREHIMQHFLHLFNRIGIPDFPTDLIIK